MIFLIIIIFTSFYNFCYADVPFNTTASWYPNQIFSEQSAVVGDIDLDGYLDLASVSGNQLIIYKNNTGTLESYPSWISSLNIGDLSGRGNRLAFGDMNSDGYPELAIANSKSSFPVTTKVLYNFNGLISDSVYWEPADDTGINSVVAFGDLVAPWGSLDLFIGGGNTSTPKYSKIYRYNAGLETVSIWTGAYGQTMAAEIANIGGGTISPELVTADHNGFVRVYRHNGTTLETVTSCSLNTGGTIYDLAVGDWNNDNKLDLAVGGTFGIRVYTNETKNPPVFSQNIAWSHNPGTVYSMAWGDLNRNGYLDLAVGLSTTAAVIYTNDGTGMLSATPAWTADEDASKSVIMCADMDNDRDLEVIIGANYSSLPVIYKNESLLFNSSYYWESSELNTFEDVNIGDINNDGLLDIAGVDDTRLYRAYINNGTNLNDTDYWTASAIRKGRRAVLSDLENDGDLDLIVAEDDNASAVLGRIQIYSNTGTTFTTSFIWSSSMMVNFRDVEAIDIDGDGYDEIIAINQTGNSVMFKNNGGILENTDSWSADTYSRGFVVEAADLDNDMDLDIVISGGNVYETGKVFKNINSQIETSPSWTSKEDNLGGNSGFRGLSLADIDQDGYIDMAQAGRGPIYVHYNKNGILEYGASWNSGLSKSHSDLQFGDVNGDGYFDLAGTAGAEVFVYMNNAGTIESHPSYAVDVPSYSLNLVDIDSDGDLDIINGYGKIFANSYVNKSKNLPNNPPLIANVTNIDLGGGQIKFVYYLYDSEADKSYMRVKYSIMGKGKWEDATVINPLPDNLNNLTTDLTGVRHEFTWDALADKIAAPYVMIKMEIFPFFGKSGGRIRSGGPIMYSGYTYQKYVRIPIDGKPYGFIISPKGDSSVSQGTLVRIEGTAYDWNFQDYTIQYRTNLGAWQTITNSTTPVTPPGYLATWNATNNPGKYQLRIIVQDTMGQTKIGTKNIRLKIPPASAPTVIKTYPEANAQQVALNSPIIARFSEFMNETTMNSESIIITDGSSIVSGSIGYNYFTKCMIFTPNENLNANTYYVATVNSNFQDIYGVPVAVNYTWGFHTDSEFSDIIESVTPPAGKTDVEKNLSSIKVNYTFGAQSGWQNLLSIRNFIDDSIMPGSKIYRTNFIEFLPSYVSSNALYIVTVDENATGVPADYVWFFITSDTLIPKINSTYPSEGNEIPLDGYITAVFNKRMNDATFRTNTFYITSSNTGLKIDGTREYNIAESKIKFTPFDPLIQGRTYIATLTTSIKDIGGLALQKTTNWKFHTPPPIQPPLAVFPTNNSRSNVLKNLTIYAEFNDEIDTSTLDSSTFKVRLLASSNTVPGTLTWVSSNKRIEFVPDEYLKQNKWYTVIIKKRLLAVNGTSLKNPYVWIFKTLPPVKTNVITVSPQKNETNVSLAPVITATFQTNLETGTVHAGSFYSMYISGSVTNTVPADVYINSGNTAQMNVKVSLPQNTTVYTFLTSDVKTILGTSLKNTIWWSFQTYKPLQRTAAVLPVTNSTNVSLSAVVEATFATNLNSSTINDQTFFLIEGTNRIAAIRTYNDALKKITLTPAVAFSPNTVYTAYCTTNIKTVLGTSLYSNKKWWFRTVKPLSDPTNVFPAISSNNIPLKNIQISADFNTNIDAGTLNSASFYLKNDSGNIIPGDYTASGNKIIFTPSVELSHLTFYTAFITTSLRTTTGTALPAVYKWSFTTMDHFDFSSLVEILPAVNSSNSGIGISPYIRITNSIPIDGSTVNALNITMEKFTNETVFGDVSFNSGQNKIEFNPSLNLAQGYWYSVTLTTNIRSIYGTTLRSNFIFDFKTQSPYAQDIILYSPTNGQTNVALNKKISVTFYTNIDSATVTPTTFYVIDSSGNYVGGSRSVTGSNVTFTPVDGYFSQNTAYTAYVVDNAIQYVNAIYVVAGKTWNFRTLPPILAPKTVFPADGQGSTGIDIVIKAKFNFPLDPATCIKDNFKIFKNGLQIGANVSYNASETNIELTPLQELESLTKYDLILTEDVRTVAGISLVSNFTWSFTTGKVIGKEGGSTGLDGLEIIIPPNCLSKEIAVTIRTLSVSEITNNIITGLNSIDIGFELGPENQNLNKPATIKVDFSSGNLSGKDIKSLAIYFYNKNNNTWERIGGTVDGNLIIGVIEQLGTYAIFEDKQEYTTGDIKDIEINIQPRIFLANSWSEVTISFNSPKKITYDAKVYNLAGKLVCVLAEEIEGVNGQNIILWNGRDLRGNKLKDGLYIVLVRISDGKNKVTKNKTMSAIDR